MWKYEERRENTEEVRADGGNVSLTEALHKETCAGQFILESRMYARNTLERS